MFDIDLIAKDLFASIKAHVKKTIDPISSEINELKINFKNLSDHVAGIKLLQGEKGSDGKDGVNGADGADGLQGEKGSDGKDGIDGKDGKDGVDGKDGKDGKDGIDGKDGKDGENGLNGKDGADGKDGKDGKDGVDGKDGKDGINGEDGEDGKDGIDGAEGAQGEKGIDGLDGKEGLQGEKGLDGKNGEDGKDALQIEILDVIDETKSYPRNTYAHHKGGLIRSYRATDPIYEEIEKSGWHVIVNGIDSIEIVSLDDNMFELSIKTTKKTINKSVEIPVMVYKGVWKEGTYTKNETTTYAGSLWVCTVKETQTKPSESESDWKLAVKKGRDGRDGLKGEKGERGAEGRAGKDLTQMDFNGQKY